MDKGFILGQFHIAILVTPGAGKEAVLVRLPHETSDRWIGISIIYSLSHYALASNDWQLCWQWQARASSLLLYKSESTI